MLGRLLDSPLEAAALSGTAPYQSRERTLTTSVLAALSCQTSTVEQVAQLLGVTRSWVYQHQQELPFTRLGSGPHAVLRMDRRELRRYLLRDERDAVTEPRLESLEPQDPI